ncbi:hypothetical protein H8R18_06165 [Nanchangia anserum]|uniref:SAF domain-containing protein n=1 Tax=Nanchangia anserum TaxID=2692125 RepID=A0A8I0KPP7_9ACTO|nr:SAF domain-containing protein [Nanchangia anserum]MBD3689120.1 hypothetical protein [Nanchangia anserum]QOX81355.1 hypothetical protein H8R18_06165 [Nanchangia anserum]
MDVRYLLWRVRFVIAGVCIAAAVSALVHAAAPHYITVEVARTSRDIGVGDVIEASMIETTRVPRAAVPDRALTAQRARGRVALASLPKGTVLSAGLTRGPDALDADPHGRVALTIGLNELSVPLARPGARVSLYAPPDDEHAQARLLAADVRILAVREGESSMLRDAEAQADIAVAPEVATVVLAHASASPLLIASAPALHAEESTLATTTPKENNG